MQSYLHTLARVFARETAGNLRDYTFVFPNRRAGLFFRKYIGRALDQPVFAPEILTINECFYSLSPLQVEDPMVTVLRLYRIYCTLQPRPEPVEEFLYWGKQVLSDFSEVDNHLTDNVEGLFATIRDLHEVDERYDYLSDAQREVIREFWGHYWESRRQPSAAADTTAPDRFLYTWSLLYPMYTALRDELRREGKAYDGMLHRELLDHWDDIPAERLRKHYVFIGFNALTRSEERLMLRLQEQGLADFYFDYSSPLLRDPANRTSLFMDRNERLFRSRYEVPVDTERPLPRITWVSVPSTVGETHEVHRILRDLYRNLTVTSPLPDHHPEGATDGIDLTRTAVVLPDEQMLLPLLHTFPEQIDKINVTMGYPLSVTPAYALLLLMEQLQRRATDAGFYHRDVTALLAHRWVNSLAPEEAAALMERIRTDNLLFLPAHALPAPMQPVFSRPDDLHSAVAQLRSLFTTLPRPEDTEAAARILTALNHLERLHDAALLPDIQPTALYTLLRALLSDQTIPYVGEPLEGLQVMGVLETRALDFDNLIITGFNDDLYPGNSHSNSYIPLTIRRGFGLPTPERKDAVFAYNFYRMLSYAQHVWLITDTHTDDRHSGEASRYLAQLRLQYGIPVAEEQVLPQVRILADTERPITADERVQDRLRELTAPDGRHGLSPSAINTWIDCRRRFYWRYIARLQEPQNVEEDISEADFGTAMHAVMEHLYAPYQGRTVTAEDLPLLEKRLDDEWPLWEFLDPVRRNPLAEEALRHYIRLLLKQDAQDAPYVYIGSEHDCRMTVTLPDGRNILLRGTIDRIDRPEGQPASTERLIDYKSGKAVTDYPDIASLFDAEARNRNHFALQTLCYCLLREHELRQAGDTVPLLRPHLFSVRRDDETSTRVHAKGKDSQEWQDVREEFTAQLAQTLQQIADASDFPCQSIEPRRCVYCPFAQLCNK